MHFGYEYKLIVDLFGFCNIQCIFVYITYLPIYKLGNYKASEENERSDIDAMYLYSYPLSVGSYRDTTIVPREYPLRYICYDCPRSDF